MVTAKAPNDTEEAVTCPEAAAAILSAVEKRIRESSYLELRRIAYTLDQGVLTLRGSVSSYYLRQVAQALLLGLDGIEAIDNRLEVLSARAPRDRVVE